MTIRFLKIMLAVLGSFLLSSSTGWTDDKPQDSSDAGAIIERATVKVEQGRFMSSVTVKGTVAGDKQAEVRVPLKSWAGPLIVAEAVPHGTRVKKGDSLLKFESDKLEQIVKGTREDRTASELALHLAEIELPRLKQQLPLDLQAAEQAMRQTQEDLQHFLEVEKELKIEGAKFSLRSAEFNVESSRDELQQLQKMYRDKDLTEETEQMILKRYEFTLAGAEQTLKSTQDRTERSLKVGIPRQEEAAKLAAARAELAWQKSSEESPLQLRQKELALAKLRHEERKAKEKLADLEHDLQQLNITAPADGIVYYGRVVHGQSSGPAAAAYLSGGTLPAQDVVLTVVSSGQLFLHAEVEEKEIGELEVGQPARISPTTSPRKQLAGKVQRVVPVPQGGKYEIQIALTDDVPESIVPGMTGSVQITTYQNDKALSVPSSAVFEDTDQDEFYVYLPGDQPKKKTVQIGRVSGDKTEIVAGLKAGDEILAAKP